MISSMTQVNWRKPTKENALLTEAPAQETAATVGGLEQKIFFGGLWAVGLIQQYRLLDWIDDRNFHVQLTVTEIVPDGSTRTRPGTDFVPANMRGCLTLAYIAGATWLPVPASQLRPLRESIHARLAQRYARHTTEDVRVEVTAEIQRIEPSQPGPAKTVTLTTLHCHDQTVSQHHMNLDL